MNRYKGNGPARLAPRGDESPLAHDNLGMLLACIRANAIQILDVFKHGNFPATQQQARTRKRGVRLYRRYFRETPHDLGRLAPTPR